MLVKFSKPTSTCAAAAGLETGTELQRILRGFYPGLADDDSVTVIHFHVLQLGDFMSFELSDLYIKTCSHV